MPQTGHVSFGISVSLALAFAADILAAVAPPAPEPDVPLPTPPFRFREINWEVPSSMALTTMPPDEPPHAAKDPKKLVEIDT